ncbi:CYTH domain-containing protein [Avibacterium sp. 20-129]|uniref:CYTH domain-containing protein n=1 Tax=Avibacterium sp. 20-129 TaxID=2911525 RepID=UPI0022468AD3|nr:CYTH domain-containing protein [Avibacterium sp. 20-129]MCW9698341.1 CYTH domain-containing protein [Avibacterium sp. 20-129]
MSTEIELKLLIPPFRLNSFKQNLMKSEPCAHQHAFLGNTYYDTADKFFAQHQMGLRVRKENQQVTLTLKTKGNTIGGLHIRPEYNLPQQNESPNFAQLVEDYDLEPGWKNLALQPIFATDFERETFLIRTALSAGIVIEIEVAIDQGKIIAGDKQAEICEVEFELKQGNIADLLNYVRTLGLENGMRLSAISKAQRGYALAENYQPKAQNWLDKWRDFLNFSQGAGNFSQKLTALFQLEQNLIEETFALGQAYFSEDFLRTVERIGAFFNLYHFYTENGKLLENAFNQQGLNDTLKTDWLALVESSQQCLAECKQLITQHSERKNNAEVIAQLFDFLQSAFYLQRMLNLISLTYLETHFAENLEEKNG